MINNKLLLLLSTEIKSTSNAGVIKNSRDKKKRSKAIGAYVGQTILILLIMAYGFLCSWSYGMLGINEVGPILTALSISLLSFVFTIFKSNSYIYDFKEYDMLMAMPFEIRDIVGSRFLYMYLKSLHWYVSVSLSGLVGYAIWAKPGPYTYISWIVLTFVIPLIPSVAAAFIGTVIISIGVRFKHTKIVEVILSFIIILLSFSLRFIIEGIAKSGKATQTLNGIADKAKNIAGLYLPADWFCKAVTGENVLLGLLLLVASLAISFGFFALVSSSYRIINSKLLTGSTKAKKGEIDYKKKSIVNSIALKEFKRLFGSSLYLTNCCFGMVMALIIGVAGLFIKADTMVSTITGGSPLEAKVFAGALPIIVFFFVGMAPTTCCSLSLEGKNYWIVQSLPIAKRDLYKGKMLMNMIISVPPMLLSVLSLSFCFRVGLINALLSLALSVIICAYSTTFGMFTGIKFAKFEWENEVEVIKQGAALAVYLFPNMFLSMGICVGAIALCFVMNASYILLIQIALYSLLWRIFDALVKRP